MIDKADALKPTDIRVIHTRATIEEKMRQLTAEHAPHEITISLLCKAAGVSRPTFYQHYDSVEDVSAALVMQMLEVLRVKYLEQEETKDLPGLLRFIRRETDELHKVLDYTERQPKARAVIIYWFQERVAMSFYKRALPELDPQERRRTIFAVGGLSAVLEDYSSRKTAEDEQQVADLLADLLGETLKNS